MGDTLGSLQDGLQTAIGEVANVITEHPIGSALGVAGVVGAGAGLVAVASSGRKKSTKKKARKKIKHTSRGWKQDRKRRSKQKWEVSYKRRKRKGRRGTKRRGVHYTKNGQPYVIMSSGKAKFIKRKRRK